jgi:hypothetical protein
LPEVVMSIGAVLDLLAKLDCNGSPALDLLAKLDCNRSPARDCGRLMGKEEFAAC